MPPESKNKGHVVEITFSKHDTAHTNLEIEARAFGYLKVHTCARIGPAL
jgi:hypothetical protein